MSNPWKDIIIDALVVNWIYKKEHEDNPRLAFNDLFKYEIELALDPLVSSDAAALVEQGKQEVISRITTFLMAKNEPTSRSSDL